MKMSILDRKNIQLSYIDACKHKRKQNDTDQTAEFKSNLDISRHLKTEEVIVKFERQEDSGTCRVCLQEGDIPIHGDDRFSDVSQELNAFAGINVRHDDEFPKHLCENCNSQLQGAIQLRTTAQYSEIILQQRIERWNKTEYCGDESLHDADSKISGNHESYDKPMNIKNMFNLKLIKDTATGKHKGFCLKIEPLDTDDKAIAKSKISDCHPKVNPPVMTIASAATPRIITYLPRGKPLKSQPQPELEKQEPLIIKDLPSMNAKIEKPLIIKNAHINPKLTSYDKGNNCKKRKSHGIKVMKLAIRSKYDFLPLTIKNASRPPCISERKPPPKTYCTRCKINFETEQEHFKHIKSDEHDHYKEMCQICKKKISWRTSKQHQALHDNIIRHVCDICGKGFYNTSRLATHQAGHSLILPFKCSQCPYKCRNNDSLKKHIRTHTGEKPYQCSECAERFATVSNLYRHKLTNHKTQRDFICHVCSRGFYRKIDLEKHIRAAHMGIKEHVCNVCGRAYGCRKAMIQHQQRVHKMKKCGYNRLPLYMMPEYQQTLESEGSVEQLGEPANK